LGVADTEDRANIKVRKHVASMETRLQATYRMIRPGKKVMDVAVKYK
jgi:hypothetical protein